MSKNSLVFLPGTLCDDRVFQYQTPIFKPNAVLNLRHSVTIEDMIELVRITPLERFTLIGFSMGGHIAQEFALKYPERIEKLILIASSSEGYPENEKKLVVSLLPAIEQGPFNGINDKRLKDYLHPLAFLRPELRKLIQDMGGADAKEVYLRQIRATLNRRNLIDETKTLKMPVLFIGGENDKIVTIASIIRSASNIPDARYVSIPQCGHFVPLEQPDIVNKLISDFL